MANCIDSFKAELKVNISMNSSHFRKKEQYQPALKMLKVCFNWSKSAEMMITSV